MSSLLLAAAAAQADVTVALTPSSAAVAPGSTFELDLTVTQSGAQFNGFDAFLRFDPTALTFVGLSPVSAQQGSLLTGACGSTFHRFQAAPDSLSITDVLLCNGVDVSGPGQLYRLVFQASTQDQMTRVSFLPGLQFYDGGVYVNPAHSSDASVQIGSPASVNDGPGDRSGVMKIRAEQNPFRLHTVFRLESPRGGKETLMILDPAGRIVRHLQKGGFGPGESEVAWDGRSDSGAQVPAGIYIASLRVGAREASTRVAVLR